MRAFEHKRLITDETVKNMEKVRDYINAFDEYKLDKFDVIASILVYFSNLDSKPFEQIIEFTDEADEFVKDKNYTDEYLVEVYLGLVDIDKKKEEHVVKDEKEIRIN